MTVKNIRSLEQKFLSNDQKIDANEAQALINSTKHLLGGATKAEKNELKAILARDADKLDPVAKNTLEKFLGIGGSPTPPPPVNVDVVRNVPGSNPNDFPSDT